MMLPMISPSHSHTFEIIIEKRADNNPRIPTPIAAYKNTTRPVSKYMTANPIVITRIVSRLFTRFMAVQNKV